MTITYEYHNSLYVNITNRCSNACVFCVRTKHDNVNGKDDLWLDREPSIEEIKADFEKRDLSKYDEIVFWESVYMLQSLMNIRIYARADMEKSLLRLCRILRKERKIMLNLLSLVW